ncbi:hypothetical protein BDF14DRAFT_1843042 [Spinellus fusiger]|nr:hypothetical protein BDF14DRAFT_1843042 [Spinellus fusiger]
MQQEIATIAALKAGCHWRENREISAGYLKRTIEHCQAYKMMPPLIYPDTSELCDTHYNDLSSSGILSTAIHTRAHRGS